MTAYTLVHYRADGSDYARGCLMSRTESAHDIEHFTSIEEAAQAIAVKRLESENSERGTCQWETTLLVDGWSENSNWPGYEADDYVDPWAPVHTAANTAYKRLREHEAEQKRIAEAEAVAARAEADRKALVDQEVRDRAEFARLREKFA